LTLGIHDECNFERGHFIKQLDPYNCGPITCTKILEMLHLTLEYEVKLSYAINGIHNLVADNWRKFICQSEQDLVVRVREQLPLHSPAAEDGDIVLPLRNSSSSMRIGDPVIAAAAGASALAEIDPHELCFCYCDLPDMELVRLKCCKQTIHRQCVLSYLCISSQCVCCSQYAHNFVMCKWGLPICKISGLPSRTHACRQSFCQLRIEAEFCTCTHAHSHQKSSP
jgi:hypothetical protein